MITQSYDFKIRAANENDVSTIFSLIKALADCENLTHEVVATEDNISKSLFGERPFAEALIGEYQEIPISFALFFYNFSTFIGKPGIYLEDLYVKPDYRKKGFGRKMLAHIARLSIERNCGRFEWSVLDWNTPAIQTYNKLNAKPVKDWLLYRLSGAALVKLADEG